MSSALSMLLIIVFGLLAMLGIITAVESHSAPCKKFRNDINSEMVRRILRRKRK